MCVTCTLGFLSAHSFMSLCFLFPSCLLFLCFSPFLLCSSLLQWLCEECQHFSLDWGFCSSCLLPLRERPRLSGLLSEFRIQARPKAKGQKICGTWIVPFAPVVGNESETSEQDCQRLAHSFRSVRKMIAKFSCPEDVSLLTGFPRLLAVLWK